MPGKLADNKNNQNSDILFDLSPEDDVKLRDSSLLSLVNYGQIRETVVVLGTDGKTYDIVLALLWDEDFIDILKKTQAYASDPVLRGRLLRRLKIFKAIQSIGDIDYDDDSDVIKQRELWTLLSRMSDMQVDYLDGEYSRIELDRNLHMADDIKALGVALNETAPEEVKLKSKTEATKTDQNHETIMAQHKTTQDIINDDVEKSLQEHGLGGLESTVNISPLKSTKVDDQSIENIEKTEKSDD